MARFGLGGASAANPQSTAQPVAPVTTEANTGPLKPRLGAGVGETAQPSALASGLNIGTVVSIVNHWREYYNPLRSLDLPRAIALYDFSRRGLNAELHNVYREMEGLYPTLIALIERRVNPLLEMEFNFKPAPPDKWPKGATQAMADAQCEALRDAYQSIDNIYEAIEWMEMAAFRGYSHLEKIYANPGTSDLTISHLEPVEQWHWTRKSMYAEWEYVPAATQTNIGIPINYPQWIIREVKRPIDRFALILWIRSNLCEKDWDAFVEIYGIPHWIVIMPPNVPKEKEADYRSAAEKIASGGSGALPNGSDAKAADSPRQTDAFRPRLDWLQEQLVLAGTGGLLSMLSMPTGIGQGAAPQHQEAFAQLSSGCARNISAVFNRQLSNPLLDRQFAGQPRLASFELAFKEQTDPSAAVADLVALSTAGYKATAETVEDKTGYPVEVQEQEAQPAGDSQDDDPPNPSDSPGDATVKNRAPLNAQRPISETFDQRAAAALAHAVSDDLSHVMARVAAIQQITDPALFRQKMQALLEDFPGLAADVLADPDSARAMNQIIGASLANGLTRKGDA